MERMFLVEKGKFVAIRNELDVQVVFGSFEDFYKYCPTSEFSIDLTGKVHLDYEPDRGIYYDSTNSNISVADAPVATFEAIINSVDVIKGRMNDPYYLITLEEAKAFRINQLKAQASVLITNKWPLYTQINIEAGIPGTGSKVDKDNDIIAVRDVCNAAEIAVLAMTDVISIEAFVVNWPVI